MLRRMFMLALSLVLISGQTFASTGVTLKQALENFNYTVTVEWDQRDQAVYQAALAQLQREVAAIQRTGMTNAQVIDEISGLLGNERLTNELQALRVRAEQGTLSEGQIYEEVGLAFGRALNRGANWSGEMLTAFGVFALIFGGIFLLFSVVCGGSNSETFSYDTWDNENGHGTVAGCSSGG